MTRPRPCHYISLLSLIILCSLFMGEVGVHFLYSWMWAWPTHSVLVTHEPLDTTRKIKYKNFNILNDESDYSKQTVETTTILVFTDPHIQCTFDLFEPRLFRWDSDKYLQRGFGRMVARLRPDMIVLLGDIFAEGYKASEMQWQEYLECFNRVLAVPSGVKLLVLPGDNDIGGEGGEGMDGHITQRYASQYGPPNEVVRYHGFTAVKLNTVSFIHHTPVNSEERKVREETVSFLKMVSESTARGLLPRPVLLFSHTPLSELPRSVQSQCLSSISPDYVISGHIHHKRLTNFSYTTVDGRGRHALEWCVPTASYRMGERHMGAGAIFIDPKGRVGYSVLWLPPRYPILIFYILLTLSLFSFHLYLTCCPAHRPWTR